MIVSLFYMSKVRTLSMADLTPENLQRWAVEGKGPLTSCIVDSQGWCQLDVSDKHLILLMNIFVFSIFFYV